MKLAKNEAKANERPEGEILLFGKYSYSLSIIIIQK